jgi:chorismate mutase
MDQSTIVQPWSYKSRVVIVKMVAQYKKVQKIPVKNASQSQRENVCKKIAELKSRQEFEPLNSWSYGPTCQM